MSIPTVQESIDNALAVLEAAIGQDNPIADKSFLMVLSRLEGILQTALYQYGENRVLQVLATTANLDGLQVIGEEYEVFLKLANPAVVTVTAEGEVGSTFAKTTSWKSDSNNILYFQDDDYVVPSTGIVTMTLTAQLEGADSNLNAGSTLQGGGVTATVTGTVTLGSDIEDTEDYRTRVLDAKRNDGGGSNLADIRKWGQETPNVARIYPYTGSQPGYRSVFVEASTSYEEDGLADAALLASVRNYITYIDGDSDKNYRQAAGSTDDTLTVASISYVEYKVRVYNLKGIDASKKEAAQTAIGTVVTDQAKLFIPFVFGVDSTLSRNDRITPVILSEPILEVVEEYGGYAERITLNTLAGVPVGSYQLGQGERVKLTVEFINV